MQQVNKDRINKNRSADRDWLVDLREIEDPEAFLGAVVEVAFARPDLKEAVCGLVEDKEVAEQVREIFARAEREGADSRPDWAKVDWDEPEVERAKPEPEPQPAYVFKPRRFVDPPVVIDAVAVGETKKAEQDFLSAPVQPPPAAQSPRVPPEAVGKELVVAKPTVTELLNTMELYGEQDIATSLAGTARVATPADILAAMNERHAVIENIGGKCRVVDWVPSELDPDALVAVFQTKSDFINRYVNRRFGWKPRGEPLTLGEWWFEHPRRASYRGAAFKPGKPAVINRREFGDYLNLWKGWGVAPRKGRWRLMRDHIEQILSGGDPKAADYNIRWTAWGYQHPDEQAEAANVFRGPKGGGKSTFLSTVRRTHGPHGIQITQVTHLTGNFNAHLRFCTFLYVNEAFWAGDKQGEAVLKGLITEPATMFTLKGVDSVSGVNCVKVAMDTNAEWVVPASHDERRYAVNDIDPRYSRGNAPEEVRKEYFGALQQELREGGAEAMLYDLLQMDLGDWHPREVPMTRGLMRQKKESLRGNFQWIEPLIQSGTLRCPVSPSRPNRITTEELLKYVKTFRGLEFASDESIASFLYGDMGFIPELSPQGNRFRGSKGGPRGWEFPPLLELRARWETKFGGEWDWHDTEVTEWWF
jgi:Family of unknown function (DUF5906)